MREKIGRPRRGGTNRNEALAAELLSPVPGSRMARKIQRRQWPIMGGRARAGDRGRPPGRARDENGRVLGWKATARPKAAVKSSNRAANRAARASRKAGR